MDRHYEQGYYEYPSADGSHFGFLTDPFAYGNKVKMDLFKKYGVLAAAGDRHLVEFLNNKWYLSSPSRRFWTGILIKDYIILKPLATKRSPGAFVLYNKIIFYPKSYSF